MRVALSNAIFSLWLWLRSVQRRNCLKSGTDMATLLQKLGEYYPVREKDGICEFYYRKEVSGKIETRLYRSFDLGNSYLETKDGKDWTDKRIRPKSEFSLKVGLSQMRCIREYGYQTGAKPKLFSAVSNKEFRRIWIGIIQTLIVMNLQMETPIHIEQVIDREKKTIRTIGWVYAHKNGENIL